MGCNCGENHLDDNDCPQANNCGSCPTEPVRTTYCDRDTKDNVWVERDGNIPDAVGICLLDTMNERQIIDVVSRNAQARRDLFRVTSDPDLLNLARTLPPLETGEEMDEEQSEFNRNDEPASIPFYAIFKGQPPFAQ